MTVERVRVGEVLALQRRPVAVDPMAEYDEIGIRSFGKGIFHKEPVSGTTLGNKRVFEIHPRDLVLSNVFAWEGAIAVASENDAGRIGSHRFMTYAPIEDRIDTSWAAWFLVSEDGLELIRKASPGSAGRNRTLAIERFEALEIPLPTIDKQRRTAAKLDRWRAHADGLLAGLQQLDTSPTAIAARLPVLIDAVLRPAGRELVPIGDLVEFVSDTVHPGDDPSPARCFVGLQHVESHTGQMLDSSPIGDEKGRKFRFRPGDVVYGYLRPYLNKVWVADRDGLCSVDQYVLRPKEGVSAELLAHQLRGASVLGRAVDLTHSLQLPRLRSGLLATITVPAVPPVDVATVMSRLDRVRDLVMASADLRKRQIAAASSLTPALLNEAFAGLS